MPTFFLMTSQFISKLSFFSLQLSNNNSVIQFLTAPGIKYVSSVPFQVLKSPFFAAKTVHLHKQ